MQTIKTHRFEQAFQHIRTFTVDFWIVIAATLINQIGNMAMVFLIMYLTQHCHYSLIQASYAFGAYSLSVLLASLFGGSLIDRSNIARLLPLTLFINGLVLLLFPLFDTHWLILLLCLIWGFASGIYRPASQTLMTQLSSKGQYKLTYSIYRLAVNLGMSIGPAIGGYLAAHAYPLIFIANGAANLFAGMILIIGLLHAHWLKPTNHHRSLELNLKWLRHDRRLAVFVLGMVPVSMVFFQHESTLAVFLHQDLHLPLTFYGFLFTVNTLIIVCFELLLNMATMHWAYRVNFLLGSILITIAFTGLLFATQAWHVLLLTVIWTFGEMIFYPAAGSYIAEIAPEARRGTYMSIYSTCSNIGMLFGPWGGAIIMQHFGSAGLWLACGCWGAMSVIVYCYLREPAKEPDTQKQLEVIPT